MRETECIFIYNRVIIKKTQGDYKKKIKKAETKENKDKRVHSTYVPSR